MNEIKRQRRSAGRAKKESTIYNIRVPSTLKETLNEVGDSGFWREVVSTVANTITELDTGQISPADFSAIVGARVAAVTGISGNHPPAGEPVSEKNDEPQK